MKFTVSAMIAIRFRILRPPPTGLMDWIRSKAIHTDTYWFIFRLSALLLGWRNGVELPMNACSRRPVHKPAAFPLDTRGSCAPLKPVPPLSRPMA